MSSTLPLGKGTQGTVTLRAGLVGGPETGLVCLAGQDLHPQDLALLLRSGEASEVVGMWVLWCTPFLLALLASAVTPGQENGAAPGLGSTLLMVVAMLCCCILASA